MRPMYFLAQGQTVHSDEPRYQQFEDRSQYLNAIEIETAGNVPGLEVKVRRAIAQVNADLAIIASRSFAEQVKSNFTRQAMIAKLPSFFGVLALVLASIGLYGVTAYSVERRTSEIGIRMALGVDRTSVLRMVLRGAFVQVGIGLAIGMPAAILAGHAMASQLFGVKPYDPLILSVTLLVLCTAAFSAALLPGASAANGVNLPLIGCFRRTWPARLDRYSRNQRRYYCVPDGSKPATIVVI
jgi:ABC-type antimicrobial peptide transport system permease subunit